MPGQERHASGETGASTVDEFCHANRISRGTFYALLKQGRGPVIMKVGSRTLVSTEAAARWRRSMERSEATFAQHPGAGAGQ